MEQAKDHLSRLEKGSAVLLAALLVAGALPAPFSTARPHLYTIGVYSIGAILLCLFVLLDRKKLDYGNLPLSIWLGLFFLLVGMTLGFLHAQWQLTAMLTIAHHLTFAALLVVSVHLLRRGADVWRIVGRGAVLALLLHGTVGLVQAIEAPQRIVEGVTDHGNVFAMMVILLLPWTVLTLRKDRSQLWRRVAVLALILALVCLPFTRSAGAALAFAIGWGIAALRRWQGLGAKPKTALLFGTALLLGGTLVWLVADGQVAFSSRLDNIDVGWQLAVQAPFTGHGPGQFLFLYPALRSPGQTDYTAVTAMSPIDHVHLQPLHTLVESGVFGLVGLVLLLAVALVAAWKAVGRREHGFYGVVAWVALLAVVVQGAISLAPARQAMMPAALALAAAFSFAHGGRAIPVRKSLLLFLGIGLLALLPLQLKRIQADSAYAQGRDWQQYWKARDTSELRLALQYWPEELESRSLLLTELYLEGSSLPSGSPGQKELLTSALAQCDTLDVLAPQYFKTPIFRARILSRLQQPAEALEALEAGNRFSLMEEYQQLQERVILEIAAIEYQEIQVSNDQ